MTKKIKKSVKNIKKEEEINPKEAQTKGDPEVVLI